MSAWVGEGSKRGIDIVGLEESGFLGLELGLAGVRMGRPAREAWIVEVGAWRWVPGPGVYAVEGPRGRPG